MLFLKQLILKIETFFASTNIFYINVPYAEKDEAKMLGAKWDPQERSWFVPHCISKELFSRWIQKVDKCTIDELSNSDVRSNGFFIAQSSEVFWRCEKQTPVFTFLVPEQHEVKEFIEDDEENNDPYFWMSSSYPSLLGFVIALNENSKKAILQIKKYYYQDYSKQSSFSYHMNHCENCNAKLGDFYMYS